MNIVQMMKQAKVMQQRMQQMQEELGHREVEGQAGNGAVQVIMTCRGEARKITISPDVINPNDKEMLEDLVLAAVNMAREQADATLAAETRRMMEELGLPPDAQLPDL